MAYLELKRREVVWLLGLENFPVRLASVKQIAENEQIFSGE